MTRLTLPTLLCLSALALTGCGSDDVLTPPPIPEPTASSTLLDLPGDPEETEDVPAEEEVPTSQVAATETDASRIVTSLSQLPSKKAADATFWIGPKEGKQAIRVLKVTLDPGNIVQVAAITPDVTFVCVEAKDDSAHTLVTVVGSDTSTRSDEAPCPAADIALVASLRDHLAADAAKVERDKERRKKGAAKDKAAEEAAVVEAEDKAAAELVMSVQTDSSGIAEMLTDLLANAPQGPKKPGQPDDVRDIDTVAEVNEALNATGMSLTGDNRVGSVVKAPAGFVICVEASGSGPSATHSSLTGRTTTVEDSGCS